MESKKGYYLMTICFFVNLFFMLLNLYYKRWITFFSSGILAILCFYLMIKWNRVRVNENGN